MPHAIRVHTVGGPDVLQWEEVELGDPGPGQVKLRQEAVGPQLHRRLSSHRPLPAAFALHARVPRALASSKRSAPTSTNVKKGDRVAYAGPIGGYAEERLIDADRVVKLPKDISTEQAAAMMLQGMTAQMLLRSVFPVAKGDTILVHAAAGGVGLIMCQWAAALGRDRDRHRRQPKRKPSSRGRTAAPIRSSIRSRISSPRWSRITDGEKLPVVYDSVGRDTFMRSLDCLKVRGLMVSFGNASGPVEPFPPTCWRRRARST